MLKTENSIRTLVGTLALVKRQERPSSLSCLRSVCPFVLVMTASKYCRESPLGTSKPIWSTPSLLRVRETRTKRGATTRSLVRSTWLPLTVQVPAASSSSRSEEHTSELQSRRDLVC